MNPIDTDRILMLNALLNMCAGAGLFLLIYHLLILWSSLRVPPFRLDHPNRKMLFAAIAGGVAMMSWRFMPWLS